MAQTNKKTTRYISLSQGVNKYEKKKEKWSTITTQEDFLKLKKLAA